MTFFEGRHQKPPKRQALPHPMWSGPPRGVLPGLSAQRMTLARTDRVAVGVQRFSAYPTGFSFDLTVDLRQPEPDHDAMRDLWPHVHVEEVPDTSLRFGVVFSDGSSWSNLDPPQSPLAPRPPFVFNRSSGTYGEGRWEAHFWVWTLPPEGVLTFIVSWPSEGIDETTCQLDATELRQRAAEAEDLWPDS